MIFYVLNCAQQCGRQWQLDDDERKKEDENRKAKRRRSTRTRSLDIASPMSSEADRSRIRNSGLPIAFVLLILLGRESIDDDGFTRS